MGKGLLTFFTLSAIFLMIEAEPKAMSRSEVEEAASRAMSILESMMQQVSRACLGDTETMPAWMPKLVLVGHLTWWIQQALTGDPLATPGPQFNHPSLILTGIKS